MFNAVRTVGDSNLSSASMSVRCTTPKASVDVQMYQKATNASLKLGGEDISNWKQKKSTIEIFTSTNMSEAKILQIST